MENTIITPKFGDFLLTSGKYVSQKGSADEVRGIYLTEGISLVDFSPNKKMYRKAYNWCAEHGGYPPSVKTLFFILFHFDEINHCRQILGLKLLPRDLVAWSTGYLQGSGYMVYNHAVNFKDGNICTLVSESMLMDDCGIACPICVIGEPAPHRIIL